jgi:hypothetical protein
MRQCFMSLLVATLIAGCNAQVWINHDAAQTAMLRMSPAYYE